MAENEGGIGGKFRKRPLRRAEATPYDRSPAAIRGARTVHGAGLPADGRGGWLSKLVDPASRLISTGASRIFSVFQMRLPALPPPAIPEGNHQSRQDIPESAYTIPSSELQKEENRRDNQRDNFDNDGIAELERLLKQKTFTRVEFDRLVELLHLRTVEPYKGETEKCEKQCLQQPEKCLNSEKRESINVPAETDRIVSPVVHGCLVFPLNNLTDQASPAELAKAYMGTRPSKSSSSAVGLCKQVFREDKWPSIPSTSKPLDLSVAPRSVIHFSGIPEHPESGYQTPRPLGRSALYRMSRSPRTNVKGGPLNGEGYTYTTSSRWAPRSAVLSGGQQVLKRGSSVLDGDFGSVGPIRRIRQKYNSSSSRNDTRSSVSGTPLSGPLALQFKEIEGSTSVQKPLLSGQPMHRTTGSQVAGNGNSNASIASIRTRSSETAHKLFQQLDRLLPSPKERSFEMKTIARDESPCKLTLDMLHGGALGSMEDLDSSKISSLEGNHKLGTTSDSHLPTGGSFFYGKMDIVEENGHPKSRKLGVKLTSEANEVKNASVRSTSSSGRIFSNAVASTSAPLPQSEKPSFQMSAPEQHLTPTMSTTSPNQPSLQKEQTTTVFNFGSNATSTLAFSSTLMGVRDTAGVKLDTGSGPDLKSSNSHATGTPAEGSNLSKGREIQKSGDLFKSYGSAVSSGSSMSSTPVSFGFGASTSSSISNGTLGSSSPAFSVSATPAIKLLEIPASSNFPSSCATTPSSTPSVSFPVPIPPFQFGSGTSSAAAVSTPLDKPQSSVSVTKPANSSSFSISNSTTLGESVFASTRSSSLPTATFAFSASGSAPSASMASGIGTNKSSSSSLFSSMGVSSSSLAPSYSFPSSGSSVFGFSGSSQSSFPSTSVDNSNPQNSTAFGGTGGSIFGTQSNLSEKGASLFSESSTSNAVSFSSSPEVGLSNASSSTFANTPFGSTTSGAKTVNQNSGFSISTGSRPSSVNTSSSGLFGPSSQASTSSIFSSMSTSSTSSSTGVSFGLSVPGSGSSPITFGSSSGSMFSFTSSGPTTSLTPSSAQPLGFNSGSSGSPGNDQMNVEDNMTDDKNQAYSSLPTFGQPANQPATPSFVFGNNPSGPQNPSTGNLELPQGGSFSLGSGGGGDKSGRRFFRAKRNKPQK